MEKQFLVDINPNIELPDYELVLCKLNGEQLQELHNIEDLEIKAFFANIDEISFKIPFHIIESNGTVVKNELYDLVDGSMMVLVNRMKYFVLTKPEIKSNEKTGEIYKTILGFSREYELAQKRLAGYDGASRLLYDHMNRVDESGLEIGFLNYIEKHTSWSVGYINGDLLTKYRHLSFSKATYLQAFQEVQKTFGCLFRFDTINKVIDVYDVTQLGKHRGLYISDKNFITNLSQTANHDEIKTRLYLYGKDNISVQSINITGQPHIDNFDFYKSTKYMSQSLIDALNSYETYITTKDGIFAGYLSQLETYNNSFNTKKIELAELITELKVLEYTFDDNIQSPNTSISDAITLKIAEINNKQIEIENIQSQIDLVNSNINNLRVDISLNSYLTEAQAKELDPFIREDEYSDGNYTEDNIQELLDEGRKILARISYPNFQFNIDVEDFLSLVEGQHMWDKFILGDLVTLEHEDLGFDIDVRLVGYTHNPDDNKLNLTFSNRNSVDDANIYLRDLLESVTTTASTVDFNSYKWDKGEQADYIINQYINNALDLAKQQILKAEGQQPILDERGIWIAKENPDGSIDPKQLRLVNNILAITNDNWSTVSTAISGDGINAELIRGKLGQFAQIQAHQIVVGDQGQKISNDVLDIDLDLDGVVEQDTLYNYIMISQENGLQVLDKANRERIRLGNYKLGKYGMIIRDKSGSTTVLDEDGILQSWQEGKADNIDAKNPLNLSLYIPEQTKIIHKAILRFKREKFRAYSKATMSRETSTETTTEGGLYVQSTLDGGGTTTDTGSSGINVEWVTARTDYAGEDRHRHDFERVNAHQHAVTIAAHAHYINMPDHTHDVTIPEHKHDIDYGIHVSTLPTDITISINDINYSSYLGARNGVFNEDREDVDITALLKVGQWNSISISSTTLGRIDATIFIQAFINTTRKSVILDDRYVSGNSIGSGIGFGKTAVTGRRINAEAGIDYLFRMSLNNNIAQVYSLKWTGSNAFWTNDFNLGNATDVSLAMDGQWVRDEIDTKYKLQTEEYPYLFWVDAGNLYVQKWKNSANKTLLASGVSKVSSIRGWKNNSFITHDQGVICAYIKTDGKVYYRNYCTQANGNVVWESERMVEEFTGMAKSINMYITNDYRVGFVIEDNLNKTHILITSRNWAGMAIAPSTISVAPVEVSANFIPIEYPVAYTDDEYISVAPMAISADLGYALTDNEFVDIHNEPIVIDEVEDWGKILILTIKNKMHNPTTSDFEIEDKFGRKYYADVIEVLGQSEYKLTFNGLNNFNNVDDEGILRYLGANGTNALGVVYDSFEKTFYPTNLVPTELPIPEVEVIWNE